MGTIVAGLEGVVAGESEICFIDGYAGVLSYRGYNIHTLADNATFEEVIFLLWNGWLPKQAELDELKKDLAANRGIPTAVVDFLRSVPQASPMDVLRTAVSMLGIYDPETPDMTPDANARKAMRLMSQTATIVTTFDRLRKGLHVVGGDPAMSFAENFLYTLTGKRPDDVMEHAFDVALTLHADHELNASTFAARVIAGTMADMHSAITGAIGALKGPLHGGANEAVMKMLFEIGKSGGDPVEYVKALLAQKKKVFGFGHRVYRTEDPRATHLRKMSEKLSKDSGNTKWFDMSRRIEEYVKVEKKLNANVDFYSASTYTTLGIDLDLFTPIFAVSRIAGWSAHVIEQLDDNRLIRPRAEYTGPEYPLKYVPIDQR